MSVKGKREKVTEERGNERGNWRIGMPEPSTNSFDQGKRLGSRIRALGLSEYKCKKQRLSHPISTHQSRQQHRSTLLALCIHTSVDELPHHARSQQNPA